MTTKRTLVVEVAAGRETFLATGEPGPVAFFTNEAGKRLGFLTLDLLRGLVLALEGAAAEAHARHWMEQDRAYREAYRTTGCGPGKHDYPGDANDPSLLLLCKRCGAKKMEGFSEADLEAAV